MKQPLKASGGIVAGEAKEEHVQQLPAPAPAKEGGKGKGARLGPSRVPRRQEATDAAIGKGEEMLRPRKDAASERGKPE